MPIITRETRLGEVFEGNPKRIAVERLWAFSGGPFTQKGWPVKNLHTDLETARAVGLPCIAASGTQCQGYVVEILLDLFGEEWLSGGSMTAKFISIVGVDSVIRAKGLVRARSEESERVRVELDVWCENQEGAKVLVGTASGLV